MPTRIAQTEVDGAARTEGISSGRSDLRRRHPPQNSGFGRTGGADTILEYTQIKAVVFNAGQ